MDIRIVEKIATERRNDAIRHAEAYRRVHEAGMEYRPLWVVRQFAGRTLIRAGARVAGITLDQIHPGKTRSAVR